MSVDYFTNLTIKSPEDEGKRQFLERSIASFLSLLETGGIAAKRSSSPNRATLSLAEARGFTLWEICRQHTGGERNFCHSAQVMKAELTFLTQSNKMPHGRSSITEAVNARYAYFEDMPVKNPSLIARVGEIIDREYRVIKLALLSRRLHVSSSYLSHAISENTGCTYGELVTCRRILALIKLFSTNRRDPIEEFAFTAGYGSIHYLNRAFKRFTGLTPANARRYVSLLPLLDVDTAQTGT